MLKRSRAGSPGFRLLLLFLRDRLTPQNHHQPKDWGEEVLVGQMFAVALVGACRC